MTENQYRKIRQKIDKGVPVLKALGRNAYWDYYREARRRGDTPKKRSKTNSKPVAVRSRTPKGNVVRLPENLPIPNSVTFSLEQVRALLGAL